LPSFRSPQNGAKETTHNRKCVVPVCVSEECLWFGSRGSRQGILVQSVRFAFSNGPNVPIDPIPNLRLLTFLITMNKQSLLAFLVGSFSSVALCNDLQHHIEILNRSGGKIEVSWINPNNGQQVPYSDLENGSQFALDSYINHTFVVTEVGDDTCSSQKDCRVGYLTVSEEVDQGKS